MLQSCSPYIVSLLNGMLQDLLDGQPQSLDAFHGAAFVGGFSYADVLGSAKGDALNHAKEIIFAIPCIARIPTGWSAGILFNACLTALFRRFFVERDDTFSLGVCNGCQLMALLGVVNDTHCLSFT